MRSAAKILILASLLALRPACGGGGGGGAGVPAGPSMPTLPGLVATAPTVPASLPGTTFPALALNGAAANQTVNTVGQTDAQVQAALQNALNAGGKTVVNTGGAPRTVILTSQLTLGASAGAILDGGPDGLTLDGNLNTRLIHLGDLASLTVQRVRFVNGRHPQNGAAINGGEPRLTFLTVINCTFDNCQTTQAGPDFGGGAIRAWNTEHTQISGCTFNLCAASNGGAVNSLGSRLTILNSKFTQNAAFGTGGGAEKGPTGQGGIGGAVYVDNVSNHATATPQLAIAGCIFNANVANDHAGAVFGYTNPAEPSTSIFEACTFAGNVVVGGQGHSGGIYSQAGTLTVRNCTFNLNSVPGNGGGIFCINTTSTIQNSTFYGNTAGVLGGGIATTQGNVTLLHLTVAQNHGGQFAGGLFSTTTTTVSNSIFSSNTCTSNPPAGIQVNNSFAGGGNRQWPTAAGNAGKPVSSSGTTFADPVLIALAANTSITTFTMALGGGSSALNPNPALSGALANDQRGNLRNDGFPDVGAFEN